MRQPATPAEVNRITPLYQLIDSIGNNASNISYIDILFYLNVV